VVPFPINHGKDFTTMKEKQYTIRLKAKERRQLKEIIKKGTEKARKITRCRILLLSEQDKTQREIADVLSIDTQTVRNVCRRYLKEGFGEALNEKPRPGKPTIFDGKQKAKITALACSTPPEGHGQWSLRLLASRAVELKLVDSISHTDVGRILKKTKSGHM
jgi:putative transposase